MVTLATPIPLIGFKTQFRLKKNLFPPLVVLLGFQVSPENLTTQEMHVFTVIMECLIHCLLFSLINNLRFESSELLLFSMGLHNIPNSL